MRRRRRRRWLVWLGALAVVAGALLTAGVLGFGADPQARVLAAGDGVRVVEPGGEARAVAGAVHAGTGDWVETPPGVTVAISLPDASRIVLQGDSRLRIEALQWQADGTLLASLRLERGQAWVVVPSGRTSLRFQGAGRGAFVTGGPSAYTVYVAGASTGFDVFQGTLVVHSGPGGGVWQLQEGATTVSSAQGTTPPVAIPAAALDDPFVAARMRELAAPSSNLNTR